MFILFFLKTGCKDKKIVGVFWGGDIKIYYLYGSVVGIEIGRDKVQGQDFAYNINGWLIGINSNSLESKRDIGKDAFGSLDNLNRLFGKYVVRLNKFILLLCFFWIVYLNSSSGQKIDLSDLLKSNQYFKYNDKYKVVDQDTLYFLSYIDTYRSFEGYWLFKDDGIYFSNLVLTENNKIHNLFKIVSYDIGFKDTLISDYVLPYSLLDSTGLEKKDFFRYRLYCSFSNSFYKKNLVFITNYCFGTDFHSQSLGFPYNRLRFVLRTNKKKKYFIFYLEQIEFCDHNRS